ncbi:hypothetical protein ACFL27_15215 [candidate division CSSED10-310 bacterium]|uniref:Uncharacterized protein n=1 Tax=candidate division CSSED10-310 bacterium TaxID=2855610 RepID=A0ABV6YZB9_UNCC1
MKTRTIGALYDVTRNSCYSGVSANSGDKKQAAKGEIMGGGLNVSCNFLRCIANTPGNSINFAQVRDLALNIATTDSLSGGGNPWNFIGDQCFTAVQNNSTAERLAALTLGVMKKAFHHFTKRLQHGKEE